MRSSCYCSLNNILFRFACFYASYEWNHTVCVLQWLVVFILGPFKLHFLYMFLSQQMAAVCWNWTLGNLKACQVFHIPTTVWITALALQAQILEYFCIYILNIRSLLQLFFTFCIMDNFESIQK